MPNLILQKIKTNKPFLLFQRALLSGGLFFILSGSAVLSAEVVYDAHTEVELVSDNQSVAPGKPFWVALRMKMDPHWHVYWRNPGDSG